LVGGRARGPTSRGTQRASISITAASRSTPASGGGAIASSAARGSIMPKPKSGSCPLASGRAALGWRAVETSAARSSSAVLPGEAEASRPSTPATIGHADEVPPKLVVTPEGSAPSAPVMSVVTSPVGAATASTSPWFEYERISSIASVAPTAMTPGIAAISSLRISTSSLPAAKTTTAPSPPRPRVWTCSITRTSARGAGTPGGSPQLFETTATSSWRSTKSNASTSADIGEGSPLPPRSRMQRSEHSGHAPATSSPLSVLAAARPAHAVPWWLP
jgi:hypothetical protein